MFTPSSLHNKKSRISNMNTTANSKLQPREADQFPKLIHAKGSLKSVQEESVQTRLDQRFNKFPEEDFDEFLHSLQVVTPSQSDLEKSRQIFSGQAQNRNLYMEFWATDAEIQEAKKRLDQKDGEKGLILDSFDYIGANEETTKFSDTRHQEPTTSPLRDESGRIDNPNRPFKEDKFSEGER